MDQRPTPRGRSLTAMLRRLRPRGVRSRRAAGSKRRGRSSRAAAPGIPRWNRWPDLLPVSRRHGPRRVHLRSSCSKRSRAGREALGTSSIRLHGRRRPRSPQLRRCRDAATRCYGPAVESLQFSTSLGDTPTQERAGMARVMNDARGAARQGAWAYVCAASAPCSGQTERERSTSGWVLAGVISRAGPALVSRTSVPAIRV
jgi:hypothetical protein